MIDSLAQKQPGDSTNSDIYRW